MIGGIAIAAVVLAIETSGVTVVLAEAIRTGINEVSSNNSNSQAISSSMVITIVAGTVEVGKTNSRVMVDKTRGGVTVVLVISHMTNNEVVGEVVMGMISHAEEEEVVGEATINNDRRAHMKIAEVEAMIGNLRRNYRPRPLQSVMSQIRLGLNICTENLPKSSKIR